MISAAASVFIVDRAETENVGEVARHRRCRAPAVVVGAYLPKSQSSVAWWSC